MQARHASCTATRSVTEDEFHTQLALAQGHLELGEIPEALDVLADLPEPFRDSRESAGLRMSILLLEGRWPDAESFGKKLLRLNPFAVEFWCLLAVSQVKQGKNAAARASLEEAMAIDPAVTEQVRTDPAFAELW
jgi:predicted Zn-dependent protease